MVAADSVLVGTVTRMTSALWIAKRAVARGGVEETFFKKEEAVDFVQQSCSTECTERLVASEPDVYEYTIRAAVVVAPCTETVYPEITNISIISPEGPNDYVVIEGVNIESFQTLTTVLGGIRTEYTREYVLSTLGGQLLEGTLYLIYNETTEVDSIELSNCLGSSSGEMPFVPPIEV